jgi:hypothetical protein
MKRIILIPVIALMMFSCKTDNEKTLAENNNMAIEAMRVQLEQQKMEIAKQHTIDSMQMIAELRLPMDFAAAAAPKAVRKVVYVRPKRNRQSTQAQNPIAQSTPIAQNQSLPAEPKKKGWSNTAKGAVIGAGVGAIGGAVISKDHRVKGAVIGGLIGAAAGAGTGILLDRKKRQTEWQ